MTRPTRTISLAYGGLTIGVGTSYDIHDVHQLSESYDKRTLDMSVVFRGATSAAAQTLDDAFRAAYTQPDGDLTLTISGTAWLTTTHAGNAAFNSRASIQTLTEFRTDLSRGYRLTIVQELPADLSGRAFRKSSRLSVATDAAGFKVAKIDAVYTANSTTGVEARAQAEAQFPGFCSAARTALGGTWQTTARVSIETDDQDKEATCSASFRQVLIDESASGSDDSTLEVHTYSIALTRPTGEGIPGATTRQPITAQVSFDVSVVSGDVTSVYATVRAYLATLVNSYTDTEAAPLLMAESPVFDPWNGRVSGTATFQVVETNLIAAERSIVVEDTTGRVLVPVLDAMSPYRKDEHRGPRTRVRTATLRTVEVSGGTEHKRLMAEEVALAEGAGCRLLSQRQAIGERTFYGTRGARLTVVERATMLVYEYGVDRKAPAGGGGAGGGDPEGLILGRILTQPGAS